MKRNFQQIGMLVVFLLTFLTSSAYDFEADGIYYTVLSVEDLTCEVSQGTNKYEGSIEIPSEVTYKNRQLSVTGIGKESFKECTALTSVVIPNSVTKLGSYAFYKCTSLAYIEIGNSVTSLESYAFYGCISLTSVEIPNSVKEIKEAAFEGCTSLASVGIGNSVTSLGRWVFYGCRSLASVVIPNSVMRIGNSAFYGCTSLASVVIPNSITNIGEYMFYGCKSLISVEIPNSVKTIGSCSFENCESLRNISLSDSLVLIQYGVFNGCSDLETLTFPGSITQISQYDYYYPNNTKKRFTFGMCDKLVDIKFLYSPKSLSMGYSTSAQNSKFYEGEWDGSWTNRIENLYLDRALDEPIPVPNLVTLELGDSIKEVQVADINKLEKLTTITCHALEPPTLPEMSNSQYMDVNVYVPEAALDAYKADPVWGKFWNLQSTAGVASVSSDMPKTVIARYNISGAPVGSDYKGLVIVRYSDGSTKKLVQK